MFPGAILQPVSMAQLIQARNKFREDGRIFYASSQSAQAVAETDSTQPDTGKLKPVPVDSMNQKIYCRQEDSLARKLCLDKLAEIDSINNAQKKDTVALDPRTQKYIAAFG